MLLEVDILDIDSKIQNWFLEQESKLEMYKKQLKHCQDKTEIQKKIHDIETKESLSFYISETAEIIEKYKKILKTPLKISFCGKQTQETSTEKNQLERLFLSIAKKYMDVYFFETFVKEKLTCDNCQFLMVKLPDNAILCENCGLQIDYLSKAVSYKDVQRINSTHKYTYERRIHFRDCINQYQGKQNCNIDSNLYKKLEEQYEKHGLLCGSANDPKEVRFQKVKKEHTLLFLQEIGYDKPYDNINLIYSVQTGTKCDDISYLEETLINDFDTLIPLYDKKFRYEKRIDRKNFINMQYVLFQLLKRHKHPCKPEDFNLFITIDRKSFHDDICKELFEELGWNHTPYF